MRRLRLPIAVFLALSVMCGVALADTLKFTASLGPEKPGSSKAQGTATLTVDTGSKKLDWSIDYSNLSGPPAMAQILLPPKDPKGQPGSVTLTLPAKPASPMTGTTPLTDDEIAGLKTGQCMLMVGNKQAPEIGGDIKAAP